MGRLNSSSNWVRGSCVGRGAYGTVSLAINKSDGRVFAVKSVDLSSESAARLEALENEIQILKSISSPWVVEYLGDDVTVEDGGGTSFRNLHLEYLPGGTAADLSKISGGDLDEDVVRSYTWCVVSALKHVHDRGIVHCDVKGRNILLDPITRAAKLADFGTATEFAATTAAPRGSPLWMAPEVVRREYQGPESDLWSLGCTVIEMVTGKPAWEDHGADTLLRIGYSDESPQIPTQLSLLGRDFLDKCLRRDRTQRWSCDQLLHHPFISSSEPLDKISHPSPRCVLDCVNSDLIDDEDSDEEENNSSLGFNLRIDSGKGRIGKLASTMGAIWESDGWVPVRNPISDRAAEVSYEEVTTAEYSNFTRTGEEMEATGRGYYDPAEIEGLNWEYFDGRIGVTVEEAGGGGVWRGIEAGSSCQNGSEWRDKIGNRSDIGKEGGG
ncbi:Mitogen-activated protein kinase kinase kinase [Bertholletia excelsa]